MLKQIFISKKYLNIQIFATPWVGYIFNTSASHLFVPNERSEDTLWEEESFQNETTPYKVL